MENEKRLVYADTVYEMGHRTPFHIGIADLCDLKELLEDVPTVDAVEVVHGRWIEKQEPIPWCEDDVDVFDVCSVCDCASPGKSNYCPNCGAKMDGDGNGQA